MHCMTWRFQASWQRAKSSQRGGQCHRDAAAAFTWLTTRCLWKDPSKKIRKEAKIYCLNTLPFLGPMHPMLGVQSGLCSHSNPIEQFLSEPRGRLLLAEVKIWLRRWHGWHWCHCYKSRDAQLQSRAALNSLRKRPRWHTQVPPVMVIHKKLQALWYALILKDAVLCSRRAG